MRGDRAERELLDRSASERTEQRGEWAARAERLRRTRPQRDLPDDARGDAPGEAPRDDA
jgi:hypothetical protein